MFSNQSLQKRAPSMLGCSRILVGEVDHFNSVCPIEPGQLGGEFLWIPVSPACPECVLATIIAVMRTTTRELHYHGPPIAPITVTVEIDQFPTNTISVEIADEHSRRCRE